MTTITSSSVVPEPFPQVANLVTNTTAPGEMKQPVSAYTPQDHPTITSMNTHKAPPASKQGLSNRYRALLFVMILLLIGGGSFVYLSLTHKDTTVTVRSPVIHKDTTVTVGSPIITTYNAQVAKDGIMFGFDAQHTRNNPYEHILNVTNVSQLHQAWTVRTGDVVFSSPTVANGLVYVGSEDDKLYAFDAATGQQKWVTPANNIAYSSPTVANGVVYVGGIDHYLYAFDATTGQQKWATHTADIINSHQQWPMAWSMLAPGIKICMPLMPLQDSRSGLLLRVMPSNPHLQWPMAWSMLVLVIISSMPSLSKRFS